MLVPWQVLAMVGCYWISRMKAPHREEGESVLRSLGALRGRGEDVTRT